MQSRRVTYCVALLTLLIVGSRAHAETFHCTQGDTGCLIASIAKSNANGPGHDYLYLEKGSYFLNRVDNGNDIEANGLPVITGALTIVGAGQGVTLIAYTPIVNARGNLLYFRLFDVAPTGGLSLAYVTLSHGNLGVFVGRRGGCIFNRGSLMVYHSTIRDCTSWIGGAIYNAGQLTLESATILHNKADAWGGNLALGGHTKIARSWIGEGKADDDAGITCFGSVNLIIERSVIDSNVTVITQPVGGAGGIGADCNVTIYNSLVSNNTSYQQGGGVLMSGGTLTVNNSTFWSNTTRRKGGGIYASHDTTVDLNTVALLYNKADHNLGFPIAGTSEGGGIYIEDGGVATLDKGWLLFNEADQGEECAGELTMEGWAVIGDPTQFHPQGQPACN